MPLNRGNKQIISIYKGNNEVTAIYHKKKQIFGGFPDVFRYLVVGGGGGGGMDMGGGGGAGGVVAGTTGLAPIQYSVNVGAGGTGAPAGASSGQPSSHQFTIRATNGGDTTFAGITAYGGGYGASSYHNYTPDYGVGGNGASGGGASGYSAGGYKNGGTRIAGQGNVGGRGGPQYYSGGGGGSGTQGTNSTGQPHGGIGTEDDILGTSYYWGGGGGGAAYSSGAGGNGGLGGGGGGAVGSNSGGAGLNNGNPGGGGSNNSNTNRPGGSAGANTGGGGGGGSHYNRTNAGGTGGSGVVIIRYEGPAVFSGGTVTTVEGDTVHTFTTSGTLTPLGYVRPPYLDPSILSYNSAKSYTGDSYPGTRYGGMFFKVKDDGTRVLFTYADYNYHRENYADLSTPWDFSTIGAQAASSNIDLSNHYQTSWYITEDGSKVFTGGYSNSNASGYDDLYKKTLSTNWDVTGGSYTTYGTNPRTSFPAHTGYRILGLNNTGNMWIFGSNVNSSNSVEAGGIHTLRQYALGTSWDLSANNSTLRNTVSIKTLLGVTNTYSNGNGENVSAWCMNRTGTQIILSKTLYVNSAITQYRFYTGVMTTAFDLSTLTVDTSKYLDLASLPIAANFNIADVTFGYQNQSLIIGVGNGSYGSTNGVKWKWLVYD